MVRSKKYLKQRRRNQLLRASIVGVILLIAAVIALQHATIPVLQPAGPIAAGERQLLITAFLLMLIIVVPVFTILFTVAWRYRETNTRATYRPNWDHSRLFEAVWWTVPSLLIVTLALITWRGTLAYDPYKPVASTIKPMTVQVIAEQGSWLFLYPTQHVASINQLTLPVNQPVKFELTADAPMNSFWVPQLGGQMYAMPGMVTQLNLMATKTGSYYGSSANISGKHFADMHFQTVVTDKTAFNRWVKLAYASSCLNTDSYDDATRVRGRPNGVSSWRLDPAIFNQVVQKYNTNMMHDGMVMNDNTSYADTYEACFE